MSTMWVSYRNPTPRRRPLHAVHGSLPGSPQRSSEKGEDSDPQQKRHRFRKPSKGNGRLRPAHVLKKKSDGKIYIVDVSIPFDNRLAAFKAARDARMAKYEGLAAELGGDGQQQSEVVSFIVGALGSWDPNNNAFPTKLCNRSYAKKMRKLCVSETIGFSRDIYTEHLTGTQQRT